MSDAVLVRRFMSFHQIMENEFNNTKDFVEFLLLKKDKTIQLLRDEINRLQQMYVILQNENKKLKEENEKNKEL